MHMSKSGQTPGLTHWPVIQPGQNRWPGDLETWFRLCGTVYACINTTQNWRLKRKSKMIKRNSLLEGVVYAESSEADLWW